MTSTQSSESTSTSSDFDRMAATESAVNILAQGKRNMVCGEIPTAVNQFQEACKLLAKTYGETAKECADAYFCYGQALLDLARMENGVLGNALQGVPDTDEDESSDQKSDQFEKVEMEADEREKLRHKVYDAMSEKEKSDAEKESGETVEVAMDTDDSSTQPSEKGNDEKGNIKDCDKEIDEKEKSEKFEGRKDEQENNKVENEELKTEVKEVDQNTEVNEKDVDKEAQAEDKEAKAEDKEAKAEDKEAKAEDKEAKAEDQEAKAEDKEAKAEDKEAKAEDKEAKAEDKEAKEEENRVKTDVEGAKAEHKEAEAEDKETKVDDKRVKVDDEREADKDAKGTAKAENEKAEDSTKDKGARTADKDLKIEDGKGEEKTDEGEKDGQVKEDEEKDGEEKDGEESMEEDEEGGGTEEEGEDTADDVSQDESQDGENPDDVSNLQLAWEMLELAKLIYSKDESKEAKLRTAESHLKLGEVSMETEQYEEAIRDFTACLTIQKEILEADNRLLAETYYQLGLANCFAKKFTESVESYQAAIKCIESRIKKLDEVLEKATQEEKESKDFDSPVYKANREVNELKELLPDIKSKIDDCDDERKNMDELKNLAKEALGGLAASVAPAKADGETSQEEVKTTDISHLIKRKRKSEDTEGDATKKARQEDGAGDAPPVTNGHSEKDESKETVESTS